VRIEVSGLGSAALALRADVGRVGAPQPVSLRAAVWAGAVLEGSVTAGDGGAVAAAWSLVVEIDGDDLSADVVGEVTVEAEEGAARVADLALHVPVGTTIVPSDWVGRTVRILFADFRSGSAANAVPLFTGRVDVPTLAPRSGLIRLRCTDDRQSVIAALSPAQVAALIPGSRWSPAVFDAGAAPWVQAADRLSTLPAALDMAADGALRLTPWAAKADADFSFTDDRVLDQSVAVDIAERSGMVNRVDVVFGYRYPRLKAEGWLVGFDALALHHTSFGYWLRDGNAFLQRAAVEAALAQTGATIVSITWIALPATAQVIPGTAGAPAGFWLPNPPVDALYCLGFAAVVAFDYGQHIEETHRIAVSAPASIAVIGTQREAMSGALEGVYADLTAVEQNILLYRSRITTIPPGDMAPVAVGLTNSVSATLTTDSDRAAADAAMETLIAIAMTKIHAAHRRHEVRAAIPCLPVLDVAHTVAIAAAGVSARGKVRRVKHRFDVDAGRAVTEFSLALCSAAGVGAVHPSDPVVAPAGAAIVPTPLPGPAVTWNGLAGQDQVISIAFPAVAEIERARALRTIDSAYAAPLPEDFLEITI
jgi:hypothetical protein